MNATQIILFEDEAVSRLQPLVATRPIFELVAGGFTLRERAAYLAGREPVGALVRPPLACGLPALGLADFRKSPGTGPWTFVNAAALLDPEGWEVLDQLGRGEGWLTPAGRLVGFHCDDVRTVVSLSKGKTSPRSCGLHFRETDRVRLIGHAWELIDILEERLADDLTLRADAARRGWGRAITPLGPAPQAGFHVQGEAVYVEEGVSLDPPVAIDAGEGPVYIARGARVKAFSHLEGPLYVGEEAILLGGRIAGSVIGRGCRVAGEVSASVFLDWSNKAHAGFVGHSYIGGWVNLGAMTTTSNLKNSYGEVRSWESGTWVATGRQKLGSIVGDHVRTAIGTLLDTGASIGAGVHLFGASGVAPKRVPPFVWGCGPAAEAHDFARFLAVAERVVARRGQGLDDTGRAILKEAFDESADEREQYLKALAQERPGKR